MARNFFERNWRKITYVVSAPRCFGGVALIVCRRACGRRTTSAVFVDEDFVGAGDECDGRAWILDWGSRAVPLSSPY
jgi:hypothetical protein